MDKTDLIESEKAPTTPSKNLNDIIANMKEEWVEGGRQ